MYTVATLPSQGLPIHNVYPNILTAPSTPPNGTAVGMCSPKAATQPMTCDKYEWQSTNVQAGCVLTGGGTQ